MGGVVVTIDLVVDIRFFTMLELQYYYHDGTKIPKLLVCSRFAFHR